MSKKPEEKINIRKAIPIIDLQNKFKEIAKLKSDLINKSNQLQKETQIKLNEMAKEIVGYEGQMKILMEFMNKKKVK